MTADKRRMRREAGLLPVPEDKEPQAPHRPALLPYLQLTAEEASVLNRCMDYGSAAISRREIGSGKAQEIIDAVCRIRAKLLVATLAHIKEVQK